VRTIPSFSGKLSVLREIIGFRGTYAFDLTETLAFALENEGGSKTLGHAKGIGCGFAAAGLALQAGINWSAIHNRVKKVSHRGLACRTGGGQEGKCNCNGL
jgi:hypothetical protein